MKRPSFRYVTAALGWALMGLTSGCADPCLDDGLQQSRDASCPTVSSTATDTDGPGTTTDTSADSSSGGPATCEDGIQNGDETDVDCGGSCDAACGDGQGCGSNDDCMSGVCLPDGTCAPPACDDMVQNGDETDVDCGGPVCDPCPDGNMCNEGPDCRSKQCDDGTCTPPACDDGVQNGDETDVDCGGPDCDACPDGNMCVEPTDCQSGTCEGMICVPATCKDGLLNGDETDVDCGGMCPACDDGEMCNVGMDCTSQVCDPMDMTCTPAACDDGVQNGDETDVDCGGATCPACDGGEGCMDNSDCISGVCDPQSMLCLDPTCADGVQNGTETDVDCGGGACPGCDDGEMCMVGTDCSSQVCDGQTNTCTSPTCTDGVQNQDETDVDCGGALCPTCDNGEMCMVGTDCTSMVCDPGTNTCTGPTCTDGVLNQDETDVDCGGALCPTCDDGEMCTDPTDCTSGVCDPGTLTCAARTCIDGVQNQDETDVDCGGASCPGCDTGEDCILGSDCISMVCNPGTNTCDAPTCTDVVLNQDETDVDCGGSVCPTCDDGEMCDVGSDCTSGVCDPGTLTCSAPTCSDGVQNQDETDADCGGATCPACPDGDMCLVPSDCISGVCDPGTNTCAARTCIDGVQNQDETDVDCGGASCPGCDTGEMCNIGSDCLNGVCLMNNTCAAPLTVDASPACSEYDGVTPVSLTAVASGGTGVYAYDWAPPTGLDDPTSPTPDASPTGFESYTVTADDGVSTAQDTVTVVNTAPFDLQGNCTLYQGDFLGVATPNASIAYSMGGTRACENGNNDFGLHLCEGVVFENTQLTGTFDVSNDQNDNDMIGFVWGAQDNSNFYSLTWKAGSQGFFGCTVPAGIVVKRVQAPSFLLMTGADVYCPNDTLSSTFLLGPAQTTTQGWVEATTYTVTIDYTPTGSDVSITHVDGGGMTVVDAQFSVTDTTFTSGFFGSTTASQQNACVGPLFASCL